MPLRSIMIGATFLCMTGCTHLIPDYQAAGAKLNGPPLGIPVDLLDDYKTASEVRRTELRRELAFSLIGQSDARCENYLAGLSAYANTSQVGLGVLGAGLGTAGGLATPERSANLLSALGTLVVGADKTVSDSVFEGREFSVVYAAVRQGRRVTRERIFNATNLGAFDTWSPASILGYLTAYDLDCGINYGLQEISVALQERAETNRRELATPDRPKGSPALPPPDNRIATPAPIRP